MKVAIPRLSTVNSIEFRNALYFADADGTYFLMFLAWIIMSRFYTFYSRNYQIVLLEKGNYAIGYIFLRYLYDPKAYRKEEFDKIVAKWQETFNNEGLWSKIESVAISY